MDIKCSLCGIILGENHLETACYRYRKGYICTDCNQTFLVKKRKLSINKYHDSYHPLKYIPVKELPPYAYHIPNIELRIAIRKAILKAEWYVWIQEKFLITWMPPDIYEDTLIKMGKGSQYAISESDV